MCKEVVFGLKSDLVDRQAAERAVVAVVTDLGKLDEDWHQSGLIERWKETELDEQVEQDKEDCWQVGPVVDNLDSGYLQQHSWAASHLRQLCLDHYSGHSSSSKFSCTT